MVQHVTLAKSESSHVAHERAAKDPTAHVVPVVHTSRAELSRCLMSRDWQ